MTGDEYELVSVAWRLHEERTLEAVSAFVEELGLSLEQGTGIALLDTDGSTLSYYMSLDGLVDDLLAAWHGYIWQG